MPISVTNFKIQNQVVAIGERALVQCVKSCCPPSLESRFPGKIIPFWIPILPERPHSDAEILKFEPLHYHTLTFAFGMTDLSTYSSQMGKLLKIGKHEFN